MNTSTRGDTGEVDAAPYKPRYTICSMCDKMTWCQTKCFYDQEAEHLMHPLLCGNCGFYTDLVRKTK